MGKYSEGIDEALVKEARAAFESIPDHPGDPPPSNAWQALQLDLVRFQNTKYGATPDWQFVLGIDEECGEMVEAPDRLSWQDAIADQGIYAFQLATYYRLDVGTLVHACKPIAELAHVQIFKGRIAHAVLKGHQGIRGMQDQEARRLLIGDSLAGLFSCLRLAVAPEGSKDPATGIPELFEILYSTAQVVMKRVPKQLPQVTR